MAFQVQGSRVGDFIGLGARTADVVGNFREGRQYGREQSVAEALSRNDLDNAERLASAAGMQELSNDIRGRREDTILGKTASGPGGLAAAEQAAQGMGNFERSQDMRTLRRGDEAESRANVAGAALMVAQNGDDAAGRERAIQWARIQYNLTEEQAAQLNDPQFVGSVLNNMSPQEAEELRRTHRRQDTADRRQGAQDQRAAGAEQRATENHDYTMSERRRERDQRVQSDNELSQYFGGSAAGSGPSAGAPAQAGNGQPGTLPPGSPTQAQPLPGHEPAAGGAPGAPGDNRRYLIQPGSFDENGSARQGSQRSPEEAGQQAPTNPFPDGTRGPNGGTMLPQQFIDRLEDAESVEVRMPDGSTANMLVGTVQFGGRPRRAEILIPGSVHAPAAGQHWRTLMNNYGGHPGKYIEQAQAHFETATEASREYLNNQVIRNALSMSPSQMINDAVAVNAARTAIATAQQPGGRLSDADIRNAGGSTPMRNMLNFLNGLVGQGGPATEGQGRQMQLYLREIGDAHYAMMESQAALHQQDYGTDDMPEQFRRQLTMSFDPEGMRLPPVQDDRARRTEQNDPQTRNWAERVNPWGQPASTERRGMTVHEARVARELDANAGVRDDAAARAGVAEGGRMTSDGSFDYSNIEAPPIPAALEGRVTVEDWAYYTPEERQRLTTRYGGGR